VNVWQELFETVEQIQAVQAKIRAVQAERPSAYLDCAWADALDCENHARLALNEVEPSVCQGDQG
jgi:hypothetical protein